MSVPPLLLEVENLRTYYHTDGAVARTVDGVSFTVGAGKTQAIMGESSSDKSVTSLSIMRLMPTPPEEIADGVVRFRGRDLLLLSEPAMRAVRGNEIGMIFQEPMSSLNPLLTVGEQIAEVVRLHQGLGRAATHRRISTQDIRQSHRDHRPLPQSAGHRALLIVDEPTKVLDVTIQVQILQLIRTLQAEMDMSVLIITHNLSVVAQIPDRVLVMYAGRIAEQGDVVTVFASPLNPCTRSLLRSIPFVEGGRHDPPRRLLSIPGQVLSPSALPPGGSYAPRCPLADDGCCGEMPPIAGVLPRHDARCHHWAGSG